QPTITEPHSIWINLDEGDNRKQVHKKSILRTLSDPTLDVDSAKSHDRLLRIRCFSIGGDHWDRSAPKPHDKTADEHLLKLEGVFATLLAVNQKQVSLAVLQCTILKSNKTNPPTYHDAVPIAEIGIPSAQYTVTGQIYSMIPFITSADSISWAWDTNYVAFESSKTKQTNFNLPARRRHLNICVDGGLVVPLSSPEFMPARVVLEDIGGDILPDVAEAVETTWVFSESQLQQIKAELLARVQDPEMRSRIPVYGPIKDGRFPYEAHLELEGTATSHLLPSVQAPGAKDGRRKCLPCGKEVAGPDRQNHMGQHILLALRGVAEDNLISPVSTDYPCGFCGMSSTMGGRCGYDFQMAAASKSSLSKPCTNVPVGCSLCSDTHWKYNMQAHLCDAHPNWKLTVSDQVRAVFEPKITITRSEERAL
ncbi:hypothetical protein R3P38DRAFT_2353477, partial [Favolaschia claudopus]